MKHSLLALAALVLATSASCGAPAKVVEAAELVVNGNSRELRKRPKGSAPSSPGRPGILLLALDGVDRDLLYRLLNRGEMPGLKNLLGGGHNGFAHAHFEDAFLSTLPSSTMAAWVTAMTGVGPGTHGVTGNEFFIRRELRLGAPAPVTFDDAHPTLSIYTDQYLDGLNASKTVYERLRERDPDMLAWVALHPVHQGADRLLVTKPTIITKAFTHVVEKAVKLAEPTDKSARDAYEILDKNAFDLVVSELEKGTLPDILTVYLAGTDLYAHIAKEGPDEARIAYLKDVVDPGMARLHGALLHRDALDDRYVVLTSDHGHTEVVEDDAHALQTEGPNYPPVVFGKLGFRLRPFKVDVSGRDYDAVLCYGGAMAYVYLADRSKCAPRKGERECNWNEPPRWSEDVIPVADAFYKNNIDGSLASGMKGTLDMVLTRRPARPGTTPASFEVYVGEGKTVPIETYLAETPHPTYVAVARRLRDLAVGPHGDRAGDVVLIAHNGDRESPDDRYYFASRYRSWHGSPSRRDSSIPLIVAHAKRSPSELKARTKRILGGEPYQQKLTDLLLDLRLAPR